MLEDVLLPRASVDRGEAHLPGLLISDWTQWSDATGCTECKLRSN